MFLPRQKHQNCPEPLGPIMSTCQMLFPDQADWGCVKQTIRVQFFGREQVFRPAL
jgi:hypothetical protein